LLISCNKVPIAIDDPAIMIDDWVITKSSHGLIGINPRDIFFVNPGIGFVVGYNGEIYKTSDSGTNWRKLNSGTTLHLKSVFFLDENMGFASSQAMNNCLDPDCGKGSLLLNTTDGGETWVKTFFPDYNEIQSLKFFDPLNGVALIQTQDRVNSRYESMGMTSDGGRTWNLLDLPIQPSYDKFFYVDNLIFITGENQKIFKSADNGHTWETINTPVEAKDDIRNLYFYNEKIGFIDGITAIYKTTDGGVNWNKVDFPFTSFETFHLLNENEGFNVTEVAAYEGGEFPSFKGSICYETKDGGLSWSKSDLNKSFYLGLTYFPKRDLGYGITYSEFWTIKKK
jgi:photosystem II stability/assembly factor-like uncharacterized protein